MPSLFDIGKSGLQAYRQSLAVTGQNIANVNTDGFKKREVGLEEVTGAGGGVTEISDQSGLGVRVQSIRRAFDEFLIDKSRQASSIYQKANTFSREVSDLENLLLPTDSNLSSAIGDFFNSLQDIAAYPDDQAARIVAVEKGKDLASQFNLYSDRITNLKNDIEKKAQNAVTSVNLLTQQISNINGKILASGVESGGSNALLDQRDLLLDQLSEVTQITVSYGGKGQAEVRLGNTGSGPVIVSSNDNPSTGTTGTTLIGVVNQGSRLQPVVGSSQTATNQIQGGIIAGMVEAYAISDDTLKEVDALATLVSEKFNEANQSGLNLNGEKGSQMFSVSSLKAIENPTNRSSVGVAVFVTNPSQIKEKEFTVMYNEETDLWNLSSNNLKNFASGKETIETDGFKISFFGNPLDGDEFSITEDSASSGMSFLLTRPQDFAAASTILISSSSSNTSEAQLEEITKINFENKTTVGNVNEIFSNGLNPVTSTEFSKDGGAAIIQNGTEFINLSSYATQPEIKFGISSSDIENLTSFTVTLADGSSVTVDITGAESIEDIANTLNSSRDVNGNAHTFRTLGLFAAAGGSTLTIASNDQNFSSGSVSASSTINGVINNPSITTASEIQIFTREGRHIAGTVLSESEIAEHLTEANGFNKFAEYRADYLNGSDLEKYRNIEVDRSTATGNHVITYGADGTAASAQRALSTVPSSHVTAAYTLGLTLSTSSKTEDIIVPVESTAGYVAGLINEKAKTLGVEASATTKVKLSAPNYDGTISFTLESKTGTNNSVQVSGSVLTNNLTNLANSINNYTGRTGVKANLSSDLKHIILENEDGDDIKITNFVSSNTTNALTIDTTTLGGGAGTNLTSTSHGLSTGDKVVYTAGGTALNNLSSGTTYYAIKVDDNNFRLASSSANASGGTAITVGGSGNGNASDKFIIPMNLEVLSSDFSSTSQSVDIDGLSYQAARFSGEVKIESSSSVVSTNDGGSTTVTSSTNALEDGFFSISSSTTGEIKTIKPVVLEGDFSTGNSDGSSSSSSILSYGLTIPASGSGTSFTTTVDMSGFDSLNTNEVSTKIVEGLRENSPSIEILGKSIQSLPEDGASFRINHDNLTYTLTMKSGEVIVSGGEEGKVTAYFENPDAIAIDTTSLTGVSAISSTEHGLETGDAITYNAAEKVIVDTTNFSSTTTILANNHSFSTGDPVVYDAEGSLAISGLTDGTTYFAIRVDDNNFQLATTALNAAAGTEITISGGQGGSTGDKFSSPRTGLLDGQTYFVVKTDEHNFQIAETYTLATNSTPSVLTIAGVTGGNSEDTFDPEKNLYISAGKTISGSQFSFPTDSTNDLNATNFGLQPSLVNTTITGSSITTPSGSDTTHFHIAIEDNSNPIGVFVRSNSQTINTTGIGGASSTITAAGHGFKTGDKLTYTAGGTALNGLTNGTSYFVKVVDANTFSLASNFENATDSKPTLITFGGGNGHAADSFATVYAQAYLNDDFTTPASSIGISAEINQVDDTNAQISIIKESDKDTVSIDTVSFGDGATAETFGFKTNQMHVNVINDSMRIQSFTTDYNAAAAVNIDVPANSMKSLVGNNLSITNLPPEDLIVIMTGNGARKIASSYGEVNPIIDESDLRVVVDSSNSQKVEVLDNDTGHSIATRLIPDDGIISAVDKSLRFIGDTDINDTFTILSNKEGIGDNRNILKMLDLQNSDVNGLNSGSFQDIFNKTVTEVGSTVRSSQMEAQDAESTRDEAEALENEKAGVSLDDEAASLIQFQQAYSANARIIQTARELFDSLLRVVS
jgi:flagellar hook-associated protein FlgK